MHRERGFRLEPHPPARSLLAATFDQARNEILRTTRKLARAIWKKSSGYYRRSLVETKRRCFKRLGKRLMARDFDRQVTELQVLASISNRFASLGTPRIVRVG